MNESVESLLVYCGPVHPALIGIPRARKTHGLSGTRIYIAYAAMMHRWRESVENFLADMGHPPDGTTLDRFPDKNGDYCPENCRWATAIQQARNRRNNTWIEIDGERHTIGEWCKIKGCSKATIRGRLKLGWSLRDAVMTPRSRQWIIASQRQR